MYHLLGSWSDILPLFHEDSFKPLLFIWIQRSHCSDVNRAWMYRWWNDSLVCQFPKSRLKDTVKLLLFEKMNIRVGVSLRSCNTNRPLAMIAHSFLGYFWLRVRTLKNIVQGVLSKTNNFNFDASRVNMAYWDLFEVLTERKFSTNSRWLPIQSSVAAMSLMPEFVCVQVSLGCCDSWGEGIWGLQWLHPQYTMPSYSLSLAMYTNEDMMAYLLSLFPFCISISKTLLDMIVKFWSVTCCFCMVWSVLQICSQVQDVVSSPLYTIGL